MVESLFAEFALNDCIFLLYICRKNDIMDINKKRVYIQDHLNQVSEPLLDNLYLQVVSSVEDELIEESEADIKNGNLISHHELKEEVLNWRPVK